jgi:hypothetical protein
MTEISIERRFMRMKVIAVAIGGEFRLKKPDHEFTALFSELEKHLYSTCEDMIKIMSENKRLTHKVEIMMTDYFEKDDYIVEIEKQETKAIEPINDQEWLSKPLQTKNTPF